MDNLKNILPEALYFENKLNRSDGTIIENYPTKISWKKPYNYLEFISEKIDPFEHGVHYDLGVRTLVKGITELWIIRGSKDDSSKIDNCTATIGWNEQGHEKLLNYKAILTEVFGKPDEDSNNFINYNEAIKTWGPFNSWDFGNTSLILWGSDFRGSMWYKIDIKNKTAYNKV